MENQISMGGGNTPKSFQTDSCISSYDSYHYVSIVLDSFKKISHLQWLCSLFFKDANLAIIFLLCSEGYIAPTVVKSAVFKDVCVRVCLFEFVMTVLIFIPRAHHNAWVAMLCNFSTLLHILIFLPVRVLKRSLKQLLWYKIEKLRSENRVCKASVGWPVISGAFNFMTGYYL